MNILICPDSFKGSLLSHEVALAMQKGIQWHHPNCHCDLVPIADGGEGSLDALELAIGGKRCQLQTENAVGEEIAANYLLHDGTAYIELALASGLPQLSVNQRKPLITSTFGTGLVINDAIKKGCKELVLCIGGSATNDAGCGIAHALGIRFLDDSGRAFMPTGGTLQDISDIEIPDNPIWNNIPITILCDVSNPFTGPTGAVATFAPQKGASAADMKVLEKGMIHLNNILRDHLEIDLSDLPGAGAAGGVGGGLHAFIQASLVPGISYIADRINLVQRMEGVDYIFTGEGKLDYQSASGKVIGGICDFASQYDVPVVAICGSVELTVEDTKSLGLKGAFSIQKKPQTMEEAFENTADQLTYCCSQIMNLVAE